MSSFLRLFLTRNLTPCNNSLSQLRTFSVNSVNLCNNTTDKNTTTPENLAAQEDAIRSDKDRTKVIPLEQSVRYLTSDAYKTTYGDKFVWELYRRNHKGQFAPRRTRKTCIRKGMISTGSPCPICRDEYLVLDYRNLDLLKQFISPHSGQVLTYTQTGLCQRKHLQLLVSVQRAIDYGLITFDVPFREYDYSQYYDLEALKKAQIQ